METSSRFLTMMRQDPTDRQDVKAIYLEGLGKYIRRTIEGRNDSAATGGMIR